MTSSPDPTKRSRVFKTFPLTHVFHYLDIYVWISRSQKMFPRKFGDYDVIGGQIPLFRAFFSKMFEKSSESHLILLLCQNKWHQEIILEKIRHLQLCKLFSLNNTADNVKKLWFNPNKMIKTCENLSKNWLILDWNNLK